MSAGTVNALSSGYGQYGIGHGAGAEVSVQYLLVDALNRPVDDVTALITSASVDFDPDKAVTTQGSFQIDRPFRVAPYRDFIAPIVTITPYDGRPAVTRQQGHLRMRRGPMTWSDDRDRGVVAAGRLNLSDLTASLGTALLGDTYNVLAGVKYTDAAKLILQELALPGGNQLRVAFPNDPRQLPEAMSWGPRDSRLKVAGDLLNKIGCYAPWGDWQGVIRSDYYRDYDRMAPSHTFLAGAESPIIDRPQTDSDDAGLANQVIVVQEDQDPARRFRVVLEVTDPTVPTHKNTIGLKPRTEVVSQYADLAAVTAYARSLAARWGAVSETLTLATHLDLSHEAYESYLIDLSAASRPGDDRWAIDGRWRSSGVRENLDAGSMTVSATRTVPFQLTTAGVA